MKKEYYLYIIVVLLVIGGLFFLSKQKNKINNPQTNSQEITLYYGDTCPHCITVEKFITDNNIEAKVKFTKKEVFNNQANVTEMAIYAQKCKMDTEQLGVPFLWTGTDCLTGAPPIIEYFKNQAGI